MYSWAAGSDDDQFGCLSFTVEETEAFLRASAVPRSLRVVDRITRRTGGLPALIAAVCEALKAEGVQTSNEPERLDVLVDSTVDTLVLRTVATDPVLDPLFRATPVSPDVVPRWCRLPSPYRR